MLARFSSALPKKNFQCAMQHGLYTLQNWYYPESRDGDIGIHRSNYYFAPSCRLENPAAH